MSPLTAQLWCWIAVCIFSIFAIIAGFGANYFGRRANQQEKVVQERLTKKIDILSDKLQPFENLANKMYPGIERDAALGRLSQEIEIIKKATQRTVLIPSDSIEKQLPDGSFEYSFNLIPEGNNVIPILTVEATSENNVRINSIGIQGRTIPVMSEGGGNAENTVSSILYRSVPPSPFKVIIKTASKTKLNININPLKINQ